MAEDKPMGGYSSQAENPRRHIELRYNGERVRPEDLRAFETSGIISPSPKQALELARCPNCNQKIFLASDGEYTERLHVCEAYEQRIAELEAQVRTLREALRETNPDGE